MTDPREGGAEPEAALSGRATGGRERWRTIERHFEAASELDGEARDRYLTDACGDDAELLAELRSLLAASSSAERFLGGLARRLGVPTAEREEVSDVAVQEEDPLVGRTVGAYRLTRLLARGGMGAVYLAERADGAYDDRVAVKMLPSALVSEAARDRFHVERQVLARLKHPAITRLLDGGTTDDGIPYLVMEYVEGRSLVRYCDEKALGVRERIALLVEVAGAVEHAHRNLVVHRDLKPSNVLVTEQGEVKLLDFGIARLLAPDADGPSALTRTGSVWMTPEYAAPEQIRGEPVSTATDVYALGMLLYELLAGSRPFERDEAGSPFDLGREILETRAPPPSVRADSPKRRRELRGDLDAIVAKALRKKPGERYGSARELVEDLERYTDGLPVLAREGAWSYAARKFMRRHARGVAAAIAAALVVSAGVAMLAAERNRAEASAALARQATDFLAEVFGGADPSETLGDTVTARELLDRGAERAERDLADEPLLQAEMFHVLGTVYAKLGRHERADTLLARAVRLRRAHLGDDAIELARSLAELGEARVGGRDFELAVEPLEDALTIYARAGEDAEVEAAWVQVRLAQALRDLGRADTAEVLLRGALAVLDQRVDSTSLDHASALASLAFILRARGEIDEAAALYEQVLARAEAACARCELASVALNNLGFIERLRGNPDSAAALYASAQQRVEAIFGPGHPTTTMISGNRIFALLLGGRTDEAMALSAERVEAARTYWPGGHWRVGSTLAEDAAYRLRYLDGVGAREPAHGAHESFREQLGELHLWTLVARGRLGLALWVEGERERGVAELTGALDQLERAPVEEWSANDRQMVSALRDGLARYGLDSWSDRLDRLGERAEEGGATGR